MGTPEDRTLIILRPAICLSERTTISKVSVAYMVRADNAVASSSGPSTPASTCSNDSPYLSLNSRSPLGALAARGQFQRYSRQYTGLLRPVRAPYRGTAPCACRGPAA